MVGPRGLRDGVPWVMVVGLSIVVLVMVVVGSRVPSLGRLQPSENGVNVARLGLTPVRWLRVHSLGVITYVGTLGTT